MDFFILNDLHEERKFLQIFILYFLDCEFFSKFLLLKLAGKFRE